MNQRVALLAVCGPLVALCSAQARWSAPLPVVSQSGFYTVLLSPEIIGRSRVDLGDLRLLDSARHEVPYLLEQDPAILERTWEVPFHLLRNERSGDRTIIEIAADSASSVDELQLRIRNARVEKSARITGSDDRTDWFMITEQTVAVGEDGGTNVLRFVDLPLSDYRFYRIELDDSLSAPVQVLQLGHGARAREEGRFTPVPRLRSLRTEVGTDSRIALFADAPFKVDRLHFTVTSGVPFQRSVTFSERISVPTGRHGRGAARLSERPLGEFELASYAHGLVTGPGIVVDTLWVTVHNLNDHPLNIPAIEVAQLEHRLVARLDAGTNYLLTTGDDALGIPAYDLAHFRDSLPTTLAVLNLPALSAVAVASHEPLIAPGMEWMWAALIGLGAIIVVMAIRLLRQDADTAKT